jgi:hypothetical protein
MSDEFAFSLKGARSFGPFAGLRAEVLAALAPPPGLAEAVASMLADAECARESMRRAVALDLTGFALSVKTIRERAAEWRAAFEHVGRLGAAGALADGFAARAVVASAFTLPGPLPPPRLCIHVHIIRAEEAAPTSAREETLPEWEN